MSDPSQAGPSQAGPRWAATIARHRADQRDEILDAAMRLLRQRGIAGLTMAAIAEEAGLSRPALYHYFADIEAVLAAWAGREVERSVALLVEQARAIADPAERLAHVVSAQCRIFASQEHRLGVEHFESETVSPAVRAEVTAKMAPLRQLLRDTLAQLDITVDPELATEIMLGILGALRRNLISGDIAPEDAARAALSLLKRGWLASKRPSG